MRSRPPEISDDRLIGLLRLAWAFEAADLAYYPRGFGSHHWIATSAEGDKRFLTVDTVDQFVDPVSSSARGLERLRRAMETAHALRSVAGCEFVVAPERSRRGNTLEALGHHYCLTVFPFVDGISGEFGGEHTTAGGRPAVVDLLVVLHAATDALPADLPPRDDLAVQGQAELRLALDELETAWVGGPYSELARAALRPEADRVRCALDRHASLAASVRQSQSSWVVTHGEPHPGNIIQTAAGPRLVDWDTVRLAPPERDLAVLDAGSGQELERYARASGRSVDGDALQLFRIGWRLADIAIYVAQFRRPHVANDDVDAAWRNLNDCLRSDGR
jgi:spectinomycin phosphotransferase